MEESDQPDNPLRWSVAQRLEFIEFQLLWKGRVKRADIAEHFGVGVHQASADLGLYETLAPENMIYDRNARRFVPAPTFAPKFLKSVANRQLLQLAAIGGDLVDASETWFDTLPPIGVVPMPQRGVSIMTMRWILEAIRGGLSIAIEYQSVNHAETLKREIEPHALGYDGVRWHVRAFCSRNRDFRDFVLSRIVGTGSTGPRTIDPYADHEWFNEVDIVLAPNPHLSEAARRGLAKEYAMTRGRLRLSTRVALAFYLIQHLNLDLDLPPHRKQLVLINKAEIDVACQKAKLATKATIRP